MVFDLAMGGRDRIGKRRSQLDCSLAFAAATRNRVAAIRPGVACGCIIALTPGIASPRQVISSTVIRSLDVQPLDLPLRVPFGISGGAQAVANNVLVRVDLSDGSHGYGEAAPLPPYNGETQADALAALRSAAGWIVGRDAREWRDLGGEFWQRMPVPSGSARCALETALLDAVTRPDQVPLWKFFGGAGTELETDMTVTTGTADEAAACAREIRARGIRSIKVKVGGPAGPAHDLERVVAIHDVAPDSPLILDGNAGLSRAAASELARGLKKNAITPALLEQWLPKDDVSGLRALRRETGWLIAADESVTSPADAERLAAAGAVQVFNIKLMKAGVGAGLGIVEVARRHRLQLMIGGNVESMLAMTMSACFAAGLGGFQFADLDTPLFLATNPFLGGYAMTGGHISVGHIQAGHGVSPPAA
jgi:L-alanine-DL-glutamate epimerase-like enolase superfamily enzyme